MRLPTTIIAGIASIVGLAVSPAANAAVTTYEKLLFDADLELAAHKTKSPELAVQVLPPILRGSGSMVNVTISGNYTLVRYTHSRPGRLPDAVVAVESGDVQSLAAARRLYGSTYSAKPMRVRGQPGLLFKSTVGKPLEIIAWKERGRVRDVQSGTPRTIPLSALKSVVASLEVMQRAYTGALSSPSGPPINVSAAFAVGEQSVSMLLGWGASCPHADGTQDPRSEGSEIEALHIPRHGNTFSVENAPQAEASAVEPWVTAVKGTIEPNALQLSFRATLAVPGVSCDTGPLAGPITGSG
jgi:hypothetical protein